MPKYIIERDLPGAGALSTDELRSIAQQSNDVLTSMAPRAHWLRSYVTDDKLFCEYIADDPETIREHATRGRFPVTAVRRVCAVIDPATAELTTAAVA